MNLKLEMLSLPPIEVSVLKKKTSLNEGFQIIYIFLALYQERALLGENNLSSVSIFDE